MSGWIHGQRDLQARLSTPDERWGQWAAVLAMRFWISMDNEYVTVVFMNGACSSPIDLTDRESSRIQFRWAPNSHA